ncbi:hypothetical protein NW762_007658 [Fusarium torreyae]|uniref:Xylanolytic transcriptional activator regulatory domain-containing protein n=1 Tax=Fusarium torreyae TaxID=1237075 RepID=A0A9W8VD01_9HYPO|nr:hypothetical protein NW762_007658 [Fusarium torreyae]
MPLYRKARVAAETDEMDDEGKDSFDVAHVQTWLLMANFEARKGNFSRAAISMARSTRVAQMLNLYREHKNDETDSIPPRGYGSYRDWITLEECRRTWWCIHISDRLISATSALPSVLDATPAVDALPASDEAFESGRVEVTSTLKRALRDQTKTFSPLALRVLASSLFHRATQLPTTRDTDEDEDAVLNNQSYWNRHEAIENDLNSLHSIIPEELRLPQGLKCQQCVFVHVLMQITMLSLYKSAMQMAQGCDGSDTPYSIAQCGSRMLSAAANIVKIFRSTDNVFMALQNPIQDHAAYMASLVLLSDLESNRGQTSQIMDVSFLQISLQDAGKTQPVALSLGQQLAEKLAPVIVTGQIEV